MNETGAQTGTYQSLDGVVARLLAPGGCPWDRGADATNRSNATCWRSATS